MLDVEISRSNEKLHGGLVEAYESYYEDELVKEFDRAYNGNSGEELQSTDVDIGAFMKRRVREIILGHEPEQRLEVYLEWNGILDYAKTAYEIAIGKVYVGGRHW